MLKLLLKLALAGIASVVLAALLLARSINGGLDSMNVRNGDWSTSVSAGAEGAGVMEKAAIAIGGLLASTRENSMYYRLHTVNGEPLKLGCRYRISGGDYDADWWSITAYGWDNYLIPNTAGRYSFNNENLQRDGQGQWDIVVDVNEQAGNWLPVGPAGATETFRLPDNDFDLLLRLYTPGKAYLEQPESAPVPTVTLEGCP